MSRLYVSIFVCGCHGETVCKQWAHAADSEV